MAPVSSAQGMKVTEAKVHLKEACLYIMSAIAIIGLIGSVACALSINGFDFGGINSIAQMVGPQNVYIALLGSTSLLAITAVLFGSHLSNIRNKQLSEKEMDKVEGFKEWIAAQSFEENPYATHNFPEKGGENGYPAAYVLATSEGEWTYRTEADRDAQMARLGLQ